jgi:hypothetical protein
MQDIFNTIVQSGQFAMLVIVACVGLMLLVSLFDQHPR